MINHSVDWGVVMPGLARHSANDTGNVEFIRNGTLIIGAHGLFIGCGRRMDFKWRASFLLSTLLEDCGLSSNPASGLCSAFHASGDFLDNNRAHARRTLLHERVLVQ